MTTDAGGFVRTNPQPLPLADRRVDPRVDPRVDAVVVPAGWQRDAAPGSGLLLMTTPRRVPASGAMPSLILIAEPADGDLPAWADEVLDHLSAGLAGFDLEDEDDYEAGDLDVSYRRFAHRFQGVELVSELWVWVVDGVGYTLTGTVAREEYVDFCDLFEEVADSFDPGEGARLSA